MRDMRREEKGKGTGTGRRHKNEYEAFSALKEVQERHYHLLNEL